MITAPQLIERSNHLGYLEMEGRQRKRMHFADSHPLGKLVEPLQGPFGRLKVSCNKAEWRAGYSCG